MITPKMETARLFLREIQKEDVQNIFEGWMQDTEVSRYMWWKANTDRKEAEEFVEFELGQLENPNWNRWLIFLKESKELIGNCLVFYNEEDKAAHWDVSYNLGKKFWGKGYTTEAMRAVMKFAEEKLGLLECVTTYAKANTGSANVLHKLGFVDEKEIIYECSGGELVTAGRLCRYVVSGQTQGS